MKPPPVRSEGVIESELLSRSPEPPSSWDRFEELYRSSRDDVFAYVTTVLGDRAAAEDVTALAFERAYRKRRTFDRRRGEERAWLFGIARNAALDELRRRRRQATLVSDPADPAILRPPPLKMGPRLPCAGRRFVTRWPRSPPESGRWWRSSSTPDSPTATSVACSDSVKQRPAPCSTARWRSSERPVMPEFDEITTSLAVIDATLAGDAVKPEHAELAELSLIMAGQRPALDPAFATALDRRVARRFAPEGDAPPRGPWRRWLYAPGAALGLAAVVVMFVIIGSGGGTSGGRAVSAPANNPFRLGLGPAARAPSASGGSASSASASATTASGAAVTTSAAAGAALPSTGSSSASGAPSPGRQVIQSAQLSLITRPDAVETVAQQVFDVVAAQGGFVNGSNVTATGGPGGYGQFELSVPSARLSPTMGALSHLRGASVASRSDSTQDVTGQLGGDGQRLAEARALRSALLRQLAAAATANQIASLKAQIRDADASIASDLSTLSRAAASGGLQPDLAQHQRDAGPRSPSREWRRRWFHAQPGCSRRRPCAGGGRRGGADRSGRPDSGRCGARAVRVAGNEPAPAAARTGARSGLAPRFTE